VQPTSNPKDPPHTSTRSSRNEAASLPTDLNLNLNCVSAAPTAYLMSRSSDDDTTTNTTGAAIDSANTNSNGNSNGIAIDSEELASRPPDKVTVTTTANSHRGSFSLGSSNRKSITHSSSSTSGLTLGPVALLREVDTHVNTTIHFIC
jgi:hypothetical protein